MKGKIFSINISSQKGMPKDMVLSGALKEEHGLEGDAHAGLGKRQVSLLAMEDIEKAGSSSSDKEIDFRPGIFAENITTVALDLSRLKIGDRLHVGDSAILRITQLGKECHAGCSVMRKAGNCIMPNKGVFAAVEAAGEIKVNDLVKVSFGLRTSLHEL